MYPVYYGFNAESTGLIFLCILPACLSAFAAHVLYLKYRVFPRLMNGTFGELENHLWPGMVASPVIAVGLFIFAWASRPSVHWMVPTIGLSLTCFGIYYSFFEVSTHLGQITDKTADASILVFASRISRLLRLQC